MNKKLLLPLFLLLLLPIVNAQLTYDSSHNNVVANSIRGMASYNNELYITHGSITNNNLTILDTSLNMVSWEAIPIGGWSVLAVDENYIYGLRTSTNPDRVYRFSRTDLSSHTYKEYNLGSVFNAELIGNDLLLLGTGSGLKEYDWNSNTILNTYTYTTFDDVANQMVILATIGDNYYVGFWNETIQIDSSYQIREEELAVINSNLNDRGLTELNGAYYAYTLLSNDLRKYTSSGEVSSNFLYVNGKYWDVNSQCINTGSEYSYIVCDAPTFNTPYTGSGTGQLQTYGVYCETFANEETCEGVCVTTETTLNGSVYVSGVCDGTCITECYTIGTSVSTGLTTYQICGNYDNDPCLEYGSVLTCPAGSYYYLDASRSNPYCSEYNYSSYNTSFLNSDWYVSYNTLSQVVDYNDLDLKTIVNTYLAGINLLSSYSPLVSDDNTYFYSRYLDKAYKVNSALNDVYTNLGIVYPTLNNGSGFASVTCDHKESIIAQDDTTINLNTSKTLTTSLNANILTTSFTYELNDSKNLTLNIKRVSPSIDYSLLLALEGNTFLAYSDSELIFNQTTANPTSLVNVYCDVDFSNLLRGCYVRISDGSNTYEVYETPVSFNESIAPASSYVSIVPSSSVLLNGYVVSSISGREGFTSFNEGTFPFRCELFEGGQVIRVYHNNGFIPSYLDFKDTYLNVDLGTLTPTQEGADNELFGISLTPTKKLIYAFLLSLIIGIFAFVVFNNEGNSSASGFIGVAGFVSSMVIFSVIGWLPVYLVIMMFILSAGIVALVFRRGVMGA